jgi:hypothetical protein
MITKAVLLKVPARDAWEKGLKQHRSKVCPPNFVLPVVGAGAVNSY